MKNFKPGQKVVYKDDGTEDAPTSVKLYDGQVYTILRRSNMYVGCWILMEQPRGIYGYLMAVPERLLLPIEPKSITLQIHEVKLEPRKVIESQPIHAQ